MHCQQPGYMASMMEIERATLTGGSWARLHATPNLFLCPIKLLIVLLSFSHQQDVSDNDSHALINLTTSVEYRNKGHRDGKPCPIVLQHGILEESMRYFRSPRSHA